MILSFSGQPTKALPDWFSPELKDRIGRTKVMILPPMQTADALTFVKDILAHCRQPDKADVDPYFSVFGSYIPDNHQKCPGA